MIAGTNAVAYRFRAGGVRLRAGIATGGGNHYQGGACHFQGARQPRDGPGSRAGQAGARDRDAETGRLPAHRKGKPQLITRFSLEKPGNTAVKAGKKGRKPPMIRGRGGRGAGAIYRLPVRRHPLAFRGCRARARCGLDAYPRLAAAVGSRGHLQHVRADRNGVHRRQGQAARIPLHAAAASGGAQHHAGMSGRQLLHGRPDPEPQRSNGVGCRDQGSHGLRAHGRHSTQRGGEHGAQRGAASDSVGLGTRRGWRSAWCATWCGIWQRCRGSA